MMPDKEIGPAGHAVAMVRDHLDDIPRPQWPEGYSIRGMRPDEGPIWLEIERASEPWFDLADDVFEKEFGSDPESIPQRCFLIEDPDKQAVGTISAWYNRTWREGEDYGQIHWVATKPEGRRKGLARAGMSYALWVMRQWHEKAVLFTHAKRVPAIKLYLDFGFKPVIESDYAREGWDAVRKELQHPLLD